MNRRMVIYTVGTVLKIEALLMLLPLACALIYRESAAPFLISIAITLAAGFAVTLIARPGIKAIYAREGFVCVALSWVALSVFGALPFYVSGEIEHFYDAFFETVSGFTTTGSSILTDVEAMSRGMLFWRSFTHWVGGMGVFVLIMAIGPSLSDRSIHMLRAESPGPIVEKIVPRLRKTTRLLYLIYFIFTVILTVVLILGGMSPFDALLHAFGTAGTGGFGIKADSVASYSPFLQWAITVGMFVFGVNFNVYYLWVARRFKSALSSGEFWTYLIIVLVSVGVITVDIFPMSGSASEAVRNSAFQVASIISTTGFSTVDFNNWPVLSKTVLLLLMFIGGCAGSTAGGFKVARAILVFKTIRREFKKLMHPRSVCTVRFEKKPVSEKTLSSVSSYLAIYVLFFCALVLLLGFENFDLETNISAAATCFNNVGPGFASVGPMASFAEYSPLAKLLLSFAMLFGRLEIFPLVLALSPSAWRKK